MKEQLITLETAKLAKEKGFDWSVFHRVHCSHFHFYEKKKGNIPLREEFLPKEQDWNNKKHSDPNDAKETLTGLYLSLPTQSLLQKWLWENHKIWVEAKPEPNNSQISFTIVLWQVMTVGGGPALSIDPSGLEDNNPYDLIEYGLFEALKRI